MFAIAMASLASPVHSAAKTLSPAVEYQLDLRLDPVEHRIEGTATLVFTPPTVVTTLNLAHGAVVRSISSGDRALDFDLHKGRIALIGIPEQKLERLTIAYSARFNDPLPAETVGIEDPSFGVNASILPEGAYLAEGIAWFPQISGLPGRHRVKITAPEGMLAVTAGHFLDSRALNGMTISEWQNDFPLAGLALSAGRFVLARDELDGIQLLTFLSPGNSALAPGYLAAMRRYLAYYRDLLGPYPFTKFAVVENFLPTGYGMPSWTLLGSSVVRLPFIIDTSLPHEIVHSWWGNAVGVDYSRGNWAEGLTTYLADYLLKERDNPREALEYRRKILRDYAALVTPSTDFPLSTFTGRSSKPQQAIGYGKGAMTFHMLRTLVGEQSFWAGLRQMAREGHQATLGWDDIERIFSTTTGTDLRWFFRQWVEQAGAPGLAIKDVKVTHKAGSWLVDGALVQSGPAYRIDIPLRATVSQGTQVEQPVKISGSRTAFTLTFNSRPIRLVGDPDSHVFRQLDAVELPATVNDLSTPRRPVVVVATGRDGLTGAARDLLKGLHWEAAEIIPEALADADALKDRDLLLLGWPKRRELQPPLPPGLTLSADGQPGWQGSDGDTVFTVLSGRKGNRGLRALFHAATDELARTVAARISHYGRYSLLLFSGGRNIYKMTWEPSTSPLIIDLTKDPQS
jgi:hypothetical protein